MPGFLCYLLFFLAVTHHPLWRSGWIMISNMFLFHPPVTYSHISTYSPTGSDSWDTAAPWIFHSWSYRVALTFWGCCSCPFHMTQKIQTDLGSGITASSCWLSKVQPAFAVQMHPVLVFELHVFVCKVSIPEMPSLTFHFFSGWKIHSWRSTNSHWCFRARL